MSAMFFLQEIANTQINVPLWGLGITGLAVASSIFFGTFRIIAANRKQTNDKIEYVESCLKENINEMDSKKVDVRLFEQTVTSIENKIDTNDKVTNKQLDKIDGKIDKLIEMHMNGGK